MSIISSTHKYLPISKIALRSFSHGFYAENGMLAVYQLCKAVKLNNQSHNADAGIR